MPAIATALVGSSLKNRFNDDSPADDVLPNADGTFRYVPEFASQLTTLTNALQDDFRALNLTICATPQ